MSRQDNTAITSQQQQRADRWLKTRAAGRWSFILRYGVLGWGVSVVAGITALDWYRGELGEDFLPLLAVRLVLFLLGGVAWGAAMWAFLERHYGRSAAKVD